MNSWAIITFDCSLKFRLKLINIYLKFKEKTSEYGPDSIWHYFNKIDGHKAICKEPNCNQIFDLSTTKLTETVPLSNHLRKHKNLNDQRERAKNEIKEQRKMAKNEKLSSNQEGL